MVTKPFTLNGRKLEKGQVLYVDSNVQLDEKIMSRIAIIKETKQHTLHLKDNMSIVSKES